MFPRSPIRRGFLRNLAAFALACPASCSGPTDALSEDGAGREFAAATCLRARNRNCAVPDTCEAEVEQQFAAAQARAMQQGRSYDRECLQERIEILTSGRNFIESDGCAIYPGPGGAGEPCQLEGPFGVFSSCAADLTCVSGMGVCLAEDCPAYNTAQLGEACVGADGCQLGRCDDQPGNPLFCAITPPASACAAMARPGEPCTADLECTEGGACHANVCGPRRDAGDPCERGSQCVSQVCVAGACELATDPTGCQS